jgi:hypothetical protein
MSYQGNTIEPTPSCITRMGLIAKEWKDSLFTLKAIEDVLVLPFIHDVLGYSIPNQNEDKTDLERVSTEQHPMIDGYLIRDKDTNNPIIEILISRHMFNVDSIYKELDNSKSNSIVIITNGFEWKFYINRKGKIDDNHMFIVDLLDPDESTYSVLNAIRKDHFDIQNVKRFIEESRPSIYMQESVQNALFSEMDNPSDEFMAIIKNELDMKYLHGN